MGLRAGGTIVATMQLETYPRSNAQFKCKSSFPTGQKPSFVIATIPVRMYARVAIGKVIVERSAKLQVDSIFPCRILGLTTFNSLLQYVNWLVLRFVLSTIVNQNKKAWLQESKLAKMLWTSRREFGTNRWKFLPKVKHFIF